MHRREGPTAASELMAGGDAARRLAGKKEMATAMDRTGKRGVENKDLPMAAIASTGSTRGGRGLQGGRQGPGAQNAKNSGSGVGGQRHVPQDQLCRIMSLWTAPEILRDSRGRPIQA